MSSTKLFITYQGVTMKADPLILRS